MANPVLIAQISDLHIKRPGEKAYGIVDTAAALERCVAHLNAMKPQPDFVVISGDLVDGGSAAEYEYFKRLLAPLKAPFAAIPGNHDAREAMRAALPDQAYAQASGAMNVRVAVRDLDLILLDSSVPKKPHGLLEPETLQWLDATLASDRARPALLFLHHPPFKTGIEHMDRQNLRNADELAATIGRHKRARMVASGHVHRAVLTQFAGIPATICPAPNHAVALDLDESLVPSFAVEPPAFHLHVWFGDRAELVTHFVPVGDFAGPYPFFDADGRLL
jgi:3',5'-cyclic AMP phosphodiesterase CpdA